MIVPQRCRCEDHLFVIPKQLCYLGDSIAGGQRVSKEVFLHHPVSFFLCGDFAKTYDALSLILCPPASGVEGRLTFKLISS
jgi:hypothetical protein